jgi:hypothetical protein
MSTQGTTHSQASTANPNPEEIGARARELWQLAGSPPGRDLEFWLGAEQELRMARRVTTDQLQQEATKEPVVPKEPARTKVADPSAGPSKARSRKPA